MSCPNILLFLTDDHGAWALGAAGNTEVRSPRLDRLAREGVRCANAFTPSPVCSPARACLLTGRTPSQVGIHDWLQEVEPAIGDRDWLAGEVTLSELLATAGYRCGLSGKWHLGRSHETPRGFAWHFGLPRWQGEHIGIYTYVRNGEPLTLTGNKTRIIAEQALAFLDETAEAAPDQPWFLQVGFIATHSPYGNQEPDLVASYADATFADVPPYQPHPWHKNEGFPQGADFAPDECQRRYRSYYAAVTDMDTQVGRILDQLRARGQLDDTLVIYASDHGLALGHHGFWGKGNSTRPFNMYDTSLRVPLLLRWPAGGFAGGRVVAQSVDHYDTFALICEAAGVALDPARHYPGRSYAPLARGEALPDWREARFGEYGDLRMIRTPEHKLVRRYPAGPDDLFDLVHDPGEERNLLVHDPGEERTPIEQSALAGVEAALRAALADWYARYEDSEHSGLRVKAQPRHNRHEAWRDGLREARGLQVYELPGGDAWPT